MKTKSIIHYTVMALLGLSTIAYAKDGSGVRGGGQVVDVDSTPALVDLVSNAVCDWQNGADVVSSHPAFMTNVIKPLGKLDWYFADDLLSEAQSLRFCFTGPLYRVLPADPDSPVLPPNQAGVRQIGYRLNDTVFIDSALFNDPKMTEYMRAYTILHEVIHSYFPMSLADRQLKLRSMVKAISSIETGHISNRDQLYFQMRANEVDFPTRTDELDAYREPIEFLLETAKLKEQDISSLTSTQVDAIVNLPSATIGELAPWHKAFLTNESPRDVLSSVLLTRLIDETTAGFSSVLADPALSVINPLMIALSNSDQLSSEKQAVLYSVDFSKTIYDSVFAEIMNATLTLQSDGRTALDANASLVLGVTTGAASPILDLPMPSRLPPEFRAIANLIISWAKNGNWDLIASFAGPGSPFPGVIGLQPIHQAIQAFTFTYTGEKNFSDRRVSLISEELSRLMSDYFQNLLTDDEFNHVIQLVLPQNQSSVTDNSSHI